jgi:hypothetical protein
MKLQGNAALGAVREKCARFQAKSARTYFKAARRALAAASLLPLLAMANPVQAGLLQPDNTPLQQFGFATIGKTQTVEEYNRFYDQALRALGVGAVVRTGLGWDPTLTSAPGFAQWSMEALEPALARGIRVLPGIRTLNLITGKYRMPTDTQWATGLREIVRMYGPNGIFQKGGSFEFKGRTLTVEPHPDFPGLTDYELWNEPNTIGNLKGAMTPARMTQLLKIGSEVMRDQASKMGFRINIVGPAIGGISLAYLQELWMADNNLFSYIDTLSIHAYTRYTPDQCTAFGPKRNRCILSFAELRNFMNSHGGAHVHLGTTEGGTAGDQGTCTGPQVLSEENQRDYMEANLTWLRSKPELHFDFWITPPPVDKLKSYSYACDSGKFDIQYWETKLGVMRPDMTMKPWGVRYKELYDLWSPKY